MNEVPGDGGHDDAGHGKAAACPSQTRHSVPVIERARAEVPVVERDRIARLARRILRGEPGLHETGVFGEAVSPGFWDAPALLLGDQREIGLHAGMESQPLEHRIAILAGRGDVLAVEAACPAFEAYLGALLGVGRIETLALGAPGVGEPAAMPERCLGRRDVLDLLVDRARGAGGFQILPHMSTGYVWLLAGEVARQAGVPVRVAGAPPRIARRANGKLWFTERVREVIGRDALPPSFSAFGPAAIAGRLARLARTAERVCVKVPDSAGGLGNVAIDATLLRKRSTSRIRDLVLRLLRARGWRGAYPVLVGVWEKDVLASPSAQLWIPPDGCGEPVIEGFFEQALMGPEAAFVGAAPARLPPAVETRLGNQAMRIALLFQRLGYFGRCSLDALLVGDGGGEGALHWIECNGRWGGVSLPMTLRNRLFGADFGGTMAILQDRECALAVRGVAAALDRLGSLLLEPGGRTGVVPLSAGFFEEGRGLHLAAFAEGQASADALLRDAVRRMAGGSQPGAGRMPSGGPKSPQSAISASLDPG